MTAAVLTGHGGDEKLVVRHDVPVPRPGAGDVLVEMAAASINNTDIWTREGAYGTESDPAAIAGWRGIPLSFPRIQGADGCGRLVDTGPGVSTDRIGQRVLVDPAGYDGPGEHASPVTLLGSERDGAFAEYVVVPQDRAHEVITSPLTDQELACLPVAYGTALGMLERARLAPQERLLVTGASGGVGMALVQLGRAYGAEVTAITNESQRDTVARFGAHTVLIRPSEGIVVPAGSPAFDVIADVVGGELFLELVSTLREGGRVVIAGAVSGPVVSLDLRRFYLHQRRLIGSSMHTPAHFERLAALAREGAVRPHIGARYALEDIHDAQAHFRRKGFAGKIVLLPPRARGREK